MPSPNGSPPSLRLRAGATDDDALTVSLREEHSFLHRLEQYRESLALFRSRIPHYVRESVHVLRQPEKVSYVLHRYQQRRIEYEIKRRQYQHFLTFEREREDSILKKSPLLRTPEEHLFVKVLRRFEDQEARLNELERDVLPHMDPYSFSSTELGITQCFQRAQTKKQRIASIVSRRRRADAQVAVLMHHGETMPPPLSSQKLQAPLWSNIEENWVSPRASAGGDSRHLSPSGLSSHENKTSPFPRRRPPPVPFTLESSPLLALQSSGGSRYGTLSLAHASTPPSQNRSPPSSVSRNETPSQYPSRSDLLEETVTLRSEVDKLRSEIRRNESTVNELHNLRSELDSLKSMLCRRFPLTASDLGLSPTPRSVTGSIEEISSSASFDTSPSSSMRKSLQDKNVERNERESTRQRSSPLTPDAMISSLLSEPSRSPTSILDLQPIPASIPVERVDSIDKLKSLVDASRDLDSQLFSKNPQQSPSEGLARRSPPPLPESAKSSRSYSMVLRPLGKMSMSDTRDRPYFNPRRNSFHAFHLEDQQLDHFHSIPIDESITDAKSIQRFSVSRKSVALSSEFESSQRDDLVRDIISSRKSIESPNSVGVSMTISDRAISNHSDQVVEAEKILTLETVALDSISLHPNVMEQTVIQDSSPSRVVSSSDSEKQISLNNFEDIEKEALAYVKQKFGARFHIVQEILRTEEKYNDNLRILQERYADQLNPEKFPKSPISVSTFRSVFDTLYALNTVSNAILQQLTSVISVRSFSEFDETNLQVAHVFINNAPMLRLYAPFVNNYETAERALRSERESRKALDQWFEQASFEDPQQLDFSSRYIQPIQRIPRYKLLLEDLLKKTPDSDSYREVIARAISSISKLLDDINEQKRSDMNRRRVGELADELKIPDLVLPGRVFVNEFSVSVIGWKRSARFFVFHDLLLLHDGKKPTFLPLDEIKECYKLPKAVAETGREIFVAATMLKKPIVIRCATDSDFATLTKTLYEIGMHRFSPPAPVHRNQSSISPPPVLPVISDLDGVSDSTLSSARALPGVLDSQRETVAEQEFNAGASAPEKNRRVSFRSVESLQTDAIGHMVLQLNPPLETTSSATSLNGTGRSVEEEDKEKVGTSTKSHPTSPASNVKEGDTSLRVSAGPSTFPSQQMSGEVMGSTSSIHSPSVDQILSPQRSTRNSISAVGALYSIVSSPSGSELEKSPISRLHTRDRTTSHRTEELSPSNLSSPKSLKEADSHRVADSSDAARLLNSISPPPSRASGQVAAIAVLSSSPTSASARYSSRTRSSISSPSSPSSKSVGTRESPKASRSRKLPFGWESAIDASSGREYFFHRASNRSQWDFPHDSS